MSCKDPTCLQEFKTYISEDIPPYPNPVTFWCSDVAHVTEELGFKGIMEMEHFRPPKCEFSWWDLKIKDEEIRAAEVHYMERVEKQIPKKKRPFLKEFTTSPLFNLEKSRYGNYRFTFPLSEMMQWYKDQNCAGKEPVLRVYETLIYKQEIVYTVLIHSPEYNERFEEYPLFKESECVSLSDNKLTQPLLKGSKWVYYQDGTIIWKAQAICETHEYKFVSQRMRKLKSPQFYVWDQVSLVFHLPNHSKHGGGLKIPRKRLIEALEACDIDEEKNLVGLPGSQPHTERFVEAKRKVDELKRELIKKPERRKGGRRRRR
ncbi:uncharacterized protein DAT39_013652 [Clarias magur]|uniref:Uncharacterized protein n=1 Tax=Clarias magur TaxID=1594786 RepID=A0A8J4X7V2_CLAMG|nr:uncharacterized protein DAT39_013652 [Clarias magur]